MNNSTISVKLPLTGEHLRKRFRVLLAATVFSIGYTRLNAGSCYLSRNNAINFPKEIMIQVILGFVWNDTAPTVSTYCPISSALLLFITSASYPFVPSCRVFSFLEFNLYNRELFVSNIFVFIDSVIIIDF